MDRQCKGDLRQLYRITTHVATHTLRCVPPLWAATQDQEDMAYVAHGANRLTLHRTMSTSLQSNCKRAQCHTDRGLRLYIYEFRQAQRGQRKG